MLKIQGFQITEQLHESDHSLVFRGIRESDRLPVILRVLKRDYPTPEEISRFKKAYELARNLELDGVIKVYSLEPYKNTFAMILEDFGGKSLSKIFQSEAIDSRRFLELVINITTILGQIHQEQIIYKDINPSNIVWNASSNQIKFTDFAISTKMSREMPSLHKINVLEGSVMYISPEQTGRVHRKIDYRSDLYSLGATFYYLLTLKPPFEVTDPLELVHCHLAKFPQPPAELNPEIPKILSDIVLKLMAKDPDNRYQSTFGLKADLRRCLEQLKNGHPLESFVLGSQDVSDTFQIPPKVFGRAEEMNQLAQVFSRVEQGDKACCLITGKPGIGKTTLVQSFKKSIIDKPGFFISGSFSPLHQNVPYAPLAQAFQKLIRKILVGSEDQVSEWKRQLLKVLGPNGQVLIDVIPEVELIIGQQPPVPELESAERHHRFIWVFQNFVSLFAHNNQPLILFLDDLQWATLPSLKLIECLLTAPKEHYFLVIGAYRDHEIAPAHPLNQILETLAAEDLLSAPIQMLSLREPELTQLLSETLVHSPKDLHSLSFLCLQKTNGNPFFLHQFLNSLYQNQIIQFDGEYGLWTWDLDRVRQAQMTDNVVEMMLGKIKQLSEETQIVMKLAACIGNPFDLKTLSVLYEKTLQETADELWGGLREELVTLEGDRSYDTLSENGEFVERTEAVLSQTTAQSELRREVLPEQLVYRFSHEQVWKSLYGLIENQERKQIHLRIGRLLASHSEAIKNKHKLFEIVKHLNESYELIQEPVERQWLAKLNLSVAQTIKNSADHEMTFHYLQIALNLLNPDSWQKAYELTLSIYEETAESAFLNGAFTQMEHLAETILQEAISTLDKVRIYEIKIGAYVSAGRTEEAIQQALEILALLGRTYPEHPKRHQLEHSLVRTRLALAGIGKIEELMNLPVMKDPCKQAILKVGFKIAMALFNSAPELLILMVLDRVRISIRHGLAPLSAHSFAEYGMFLCGAVGDYETGHKFGQLALSLAQKQGNIDSLPGILYIVNACIRPWKESVQQTLEPLKQAFQVGLDNGTVEYAAMAAMSYCAYAFYYGKELKALIKETEKYSELILRTQQHSALHFHQMTHQVMANLLGQNQDPTRLEGEFYSEEQGRQLCLMKQIRPALGLLYLHKIFLCYLLQDLTQAQEHSETGKAYLEGLTGTLGYPEYLFYDSLVQLMPATGFPHKLNMIRALSHVNSNQSKMKKWAHHAPSNYDHKYYLIEAELARVLDKKNTAIKFYDQAIHLAHKQGYLIEEALANELTAKFYLGLGKETIAKVYMKEAHYLYLKWGGIIKVMQLEKDHPQLLSMYALSTRGSGDDIKTFTASEEVSSAMDLSSVMKASQILSSEVHLDELLKKLIKIVIENAGAQRGCLLLENKNQWFIEAEGHVDQEEVTVLQSRPLTLAENNHTAHLPVSLINYVIRTHEPVILKDASHEGEFSHEMDVSQNQLKSVLCIPLLNQRQLTGVLYLENNLATYAFTQNRMEMLVLLSSQIAISIENARLYNSLREALNHQVELTNSYSRFVPDALLNFLEKESIVDVELGDQVEKDMTIMFTDIRDFTSLSEKMTPQENFHFINAYLSEMEPLIDRHQGVIDKYIGDAIMALFPSNADDALKSAIAMLCHLAQYNQEQSHRSDPIRIGIGLNTGPLMLGTIGGKNRMDATVISDAVNLAARLEGMTKLYGASLLISEYTLNRLVDPKAYLIRFIDMVKVKGKSDPVRVYDVFDGALPEVQKRKMATLKEFEEGVSLYQQREFEKAKNFFKECQKKDPKDKATEIYIQRCDHYLRVGWDDAWDGVIQLEHK
ncbi:AAA family ATPase [Deltaproteobacteria bacterium TL4]